MVSASESKQLSVRITTSVGVFSFFKEMAILRKRLFSSIVTFSGALNRLPGPFVPNEEELPFKPPLVDPVKLEEFELSVAVEFFRFTSLPPAPGDILGPNLNCSSKSAKSINLTIFSSSWNSLKIVPLT